MIEIVSVIATKARPDSLSKALDSVLRQSLKPSTIIVVGETEKDVAIPIEPSGSLRPANIVSLINSRTENLSGALNTALLFLVSRGVETENTFIAFLDDDDKWDSSYLAKCAMSVNRTCSDMVVTGIIRHASLEDSGRRQSIPQRLEATSFLTTNPHIQGSNLFVRLSSLLRAGAFDENLDSTTDRDVCIRLFDLGDVRVSYLNEHLVHHYATGESRISSFGSFRKKQGLVEFFRKYAPRMDASQKKEFKRRAVEIFGCSESDFSFAKLDINKTYSGNQILSFSAPAESVDFVVGLTSSNLKSTKLLLDDLRHVFSGFDGRKKLVVCDNTKDSEELERILSSLEKEIEVKLVGRDLVENDAQLGKFGRYYETAFRRNGIAYGRTVLHHYLYLESLDLSRPIVWVLDDDIRVDKILLDSIELKPADFARYVSSLSREGCSIAIGKIAGDAPLPAGSMIRTELLDFLFNLRVMTAKSNLEITPELKRLQNGLIIEKYPDYYYDLTMRRTGHLEAPMWYQSQEQDTLKASDSLLLDFTLICNGVNPFRSIQLSSTIAEMTETGIPIRGGNTLVFDMECLRTFPNIAPISEGVRFRRGDTIWAVLNQEIGGRKVSSRRKKVVSIPLHVRQDRNNSERSDLRLQTVFDDIYGASLVRVLKDHLSNKRSRLGEKASAHELLHSSEEEIRQMFFDFDAKVKHRLGMLQINSWRTNGLVDSIRYFLRQIGDMDDKQSEIVRKRIDSVESVLLEIEREFSKDRMAECLESLESARSELRAFLENFEEYCVSYREKLPVHASSHEIEDTERFIETEFHAKDLVVLGEGSEGVVFTDGIRIYKHFHHGLYHFEGRKLEQIQDLLRLGKGLKHLAAAEKIVNIGDRVILVSSLIKGETYKGGYLNEIIDLLRECRANGICLNNVCPENLLVTESGLTYIDLGSSISKFSKEAFELMCKRAYLTYRWHFRKDLKELLTRSLKQDDLPELFGFEHFRASVEVTDTHQLIDPILIPMLADSEAEEILDYGCGSGVIANKLAKLGKQVIAYDIDGRAFNEKRSRTEGLRFIDRKGLNEILHSGKTFDCIVCNLVICTIYDDEESKRVFSECRKLLSPNGSLFLGICNPFDISTLMSTSFAKELPAWANYQSKFVYEKKSVKTGKRRKDVHRSFEWYQHVIERAGFQIDELKEVPSVDIPLLSPSSEFLLLKLEASPVRESNVSLLIKAGTMEWRSIRKQVEHIVKQLEGPQKFRERIVVTDSYEGPFARQFDKGDWKNFRKELQFLVNSGVIDQYYVAPSDIESIANISSRWFGLKSSSLRSENGQPTLTTLFGFEKCKGQYILQLDSDCIIGKRRKDHDYLGELLKVFSKDGSALTVSLPIAGTTYNTFTTHNENGKWRTEVRCCLLSKCRLGKLLPLPNSLNGNGILEKPWHRSLDLSLSKTTWQSYRGGSPDTFFIHIQNDRKKDFNSWYNIMKAVEAGRTIQDQIGRVDLVGSVEDWLDRRKEPLIFVLRGRNVAIPKIRRCIDSLLAQKGGDWGAILIDAASENGAEEYLEKIVSERLQDKVTFYRNLTPASPIENTYVAITKLCRNSDSIIVLLDLDDALIGDRVVEKFTEAYHKGADVTVGTMLRTDKHIEYPVDFENPRISRGGNIWQHLRTFRKYLFDKISSDDLKVDGDWVPHTEDWAFMLPIVELSKKPVHITVPIYFYEPSVKALSSEERESMIAKIVSKKSYKVN